MKKFLAWANRSKKNQAYACLIGAVVLFGFWVIVAHVF